MCGGVGGGGEKMKVHRWMETLLICLTHSAQMKMDGGIPDVLIRRWMTVQLRL